MTETEQSRPEYDKTWIYQEWRGACRTCGWFSTIGYKTSEQALRATDAHAFVHHSGKVWFE